MRRGVIALDRTVGLLIALALIAGGALAICWWYDVLPAAPNQLKLHAPADYTATSWWPWATGAAGVVLILLGLWWLVRHVPRRVSGRFSLPGSNQYGRLHADAHAAVAAAATDLTRIPEIRDGSGRVVADRGELVAELQCTIEPTADLETVHAAVTRTAAALHTVLGLPHLRHRVRIRVARNDRTTAPARVV
jgi:hypothetical protein